MSKGLFTKALLVALTLGAVVGCSAPPPMSRCIVVRKEHHSAWVQHAGKTIIFHPERWTVDVSGMVASNCYEIRTIKVGEDEWNRVTNGMHYHDL